MTEYRSTLRMWVPSGNPEASRPATSGLKEGDLANICMLLYSLGEQHAYREATKLCKGQEIAHMAAIFESLERETEAKLNQRFGGVSCGQPRLDLPSQLPSLPNRPCTAEASKPGKRTHNLTPEGRARLSEQMKARWAARRAALANTHPQHNEGVEHVLVAEQGDRNG